MGALLFLYVFGVCCAFAFALSIDPKRDMAGQFLFFAFLWPIGVTYVLLVLLIDWLQGKFEK